VGNLAQQRNQQGLATTAQVGGRALTAHSEGQAANDTEFSRNQDANAARWDATSKGVELPDDAYGDLVGLNDRALTRSQGNINNATNSQVLRSTDPATQRFYDSLTLREDNDAVTRELNRRQGR
jgi:hypothetical protein